MTLKKSIFVSIAIVFQLLGFGNRAMAQTVLPCASIAGSYGLDSALVVDSTHLDTWLAEQADSSFSNLSMQCSLLDAKVQQMINSLRNNYIIKNDTLWLDSTACIVDHEQFINKLDTLGQSLQQRTAMYDRLEQDRILEEQRKAEEAARARALAQQQVRNDSAMVMKKELEEQHNRIGDLCDGIGVSDKERLKQLKDIYYSYLSVYNKYDLSLINVSTLQLQAMEELQRLQTHILDSVLGQNSYHARIARFPAQLKVRSSNGHKEVYKSYQRNMRVEVPIHFSSLSEYDRFVQMLKDVIVVQQLYVEVIEVREEITRNSTAVLKHASKRSQVQDSYEEALALIDQVPTFIYIKEGDEFIERLRTFTEVQHRYIEAINHLDSIDMHGRQLLKQCKEYKDLTTGYKELCEVYDFTISFSTLEGADFFERSMDDFEILQNTYLHILSQRQNIDRLEKQIKSDNNLPRDVKTGYKEIKELTKFKPDFANVAQSEAFVDNIDAFIAVQQQVVQIEEKQKNIEDNLKQLKSMSKANAPIVKAYHVLRDEAEQKFTILSLSDLEAYERYQERQLYLQEKFLGVIQGSDRADYNRRLDGVRNSEKIHAIMNL